MRNEVLHGYLIHHRKYRERSHIVHLFTQEHGRVDGILRQTPPPQYQPICLQASGKSELKNFTKLEIDGIYVFGLPAKDKEYIFELYSETDKKLVLKHLCDKFKSYSNEFKGSIGHFGCNQISMNETYKFNTCFSSSLEMLNNNIIRRLYEKIKQNHPEKGNSK